MTVLFPSQLTAQELCGHHPGVARQVTLSKDPIFFNPLFSVVLTPLHIALEYGSLIAKDPDFEPQLYLLAV